VLGGELACMVIADPPYGVKIAGNVSGKASAREFVMMSGEQTSPELIAFFRAVMRNSARFSVPGSIHYYFIDWRHIREMLDAAEGVYEQFKQTIVWDKGVGGQGAFYRSQHELICVFKAGKGRHINNFLLGEKGRYRTNVVKYPGANTFRKGRTRDLADHSTVKPTPMYVDFLLDCSHRGDLVLDPFSGSGTLLLAAHKAKRRGAAIELDPLYVDTALRRLSDATGLTPVLAGDGRSFREIAEARASNPED
jgi:DNA modification methylase